jgi:hypothetical protein
MKTFHSRYHWVAIAAAAAFALLTLSNAYGQRADAGSMFQGRPAMAGAQAGTGAMAGPPQGGIGLQGSENSGRTIGRPPGLDDMAQGTVTGTADALAVNRAVRNDRDIVPRDRDDNLLRRDRDDGVVRQDRDDGVIQRDRDGNVVRRDRDSGVAKQQRSATKKTKRAAKQVADQARHGVGTPGS